MKAYRSFNFATVAALALIVSGVVSLAGGSLPRHYLVALFNDPKDLPALRGDGRVHFEPPAKACALEVAGLLPAAIQRVETVQGRPFKHSPAIGVYAFYDAYARANGLENPAIAATSRSGRVILSPTLCENERDRLVGVLTHELSHSHLFGWRSSIFSARPPSWFTEGLAVMASGGGGAEGVSDAEAAEAIRKGYAIRITDEGVWRDFASIRFEVEPPAIGRSDDVITFRQRLAYRQAGMYVAWLREYDPDAFVRLMQRVEDGESFSTSFRAGYGANPEEQWLNFRRRL